MKEGVSLFSIFKKLFPEKGWSAEFENSISGILLFSVSFIYYYFFGTGLFFHMENNSLFIYSADYLLKFTDKPGGLLNYCGSFLTQFFYSPFYGSLIVSVLFLIFFLIIKRIAEILNAGSSYNLLLTLTPSCLLLLLQTRYDFQVHIILGFLILITWFFISISTGSNRVRLILIILIPLLYYLIGSFVIVYVGLYISYNLFYQKGNRRYLMPAVLVSATVITFYLFKDLIFLQPLNRLLDYPLFLNETARLTMFMILFSSFIVLFPLLLKAIRSIPGIKISERYGPPLTMLFIFMLTVLYSAQEL